MNRVWLLTKIFFKTGFGNTRRGKKRTNSKIGNIILLLITLPLIMFGVGAMMFGIYEGLHMLNQDALLIGLSYSLVSLIIFVFGMMSVISIFYFSKDIDFVLPLPFKPHEITLAKYITVVVYQYMLEAFILLPAIGIYGFRTGAGLQFYLAGLVCFIFMPILPVTYCSIVAMLLMRFTNLAKHKDGFRVITGLIAICIPIGINLVSNSFGSKANANPDAQRQLLEHWMTNKNSALDSLSNVFITSKIGTYATVAETPSKMAVNLLLFVLINILAIVVFIFIADALYLKGAVGNSESFSSRKELKKEVLDKSTKEKSQLMTWFNKEMVLLFRTPAYLLNCISTIVIIPVVMLIPMLSQGGGIDNISKHVGEILSEPKSYNIVIAVAFAVIIFFTASNPVASTSISREGDNVYVSKFLPVSFMTQMMAKVLSSVAINSILIVVFAIGALIIKVPITLILLIFILAMLEIVMFAMIGLLIDLHSPKLVWDDEQKAVKQNFNSMKSLLIGLVVGGAGTAATIFIGANYIISYFALALFTLIADVLLYKVLSTVGYKLFNKIAD
jgi:ABC-2 type transport system permease protein